MKIGMHRLVRRVRAVAVQGAGAVAMAAAAAAPAAAHEVHETLRQEQATVIELRYADGEPFSFEHYELFVGDGAKPVLTGRTDAQGRVVFLPDQAARWRVRAFSADGHGVDAAFEVAAAASAGRATAAPGVSLDRASRVLLGVLVILTLFCALQRFVRRRKPADATTIDRSDAHP